MIDQIVVVYCFCDEITKAVNFKDDPQCQMSSAEVMTFAVISAMHFGGDYRKTRLFAKHHNYFSKVLSLSQLVRRIHQIPETVWYCVFLSLQAFLKNEDVETFIVDSFPVKAYENHKSFRARIFAGKEYHGYTASKKQYFFGIKVHMLIDENGVPIEFVFSPGSASDITTFQGFSLQLPIHSTILGDRAYTSYQFEDALMNLDGVRLLPKRKQNLKRQPSGSEAFILSRQRNLIETAFSSIVSRMPRYIRARTEKGFCLKVFFFILAYMVNLYFPVE